MEDEVKQIANHYGRFSQLNKTQEELAECIEAIEDAKALVQTSKMSVEEYGRLLDHLAEEIADSEIMLVQLKYLFDLGSRVERWKKYKIQRQLKRMAQEA